MAPSHHPMLRRIQAGVLIGLFAWGLYAAVGILRMRLPMSFPPPLHGSYVAVSAHVPPSHRLKDWLSNLVRATVDDARLGS